ncbi:unnamed protein product [Cladocopium goreaui]|uniref:Nitrate transporter n=1 Tax=Cladocopium goreaui TaxID=2562237 RepID=A0A9P1CGP4_9DINO|nr:unnamed protein product [Cladocopium goreaui]
MPDFKLAVDKNNKATELALLRVCGTVQQNPHMRAFWASTISCFLAFLGWFALAPLALEVATSMGTCENQLYPPEDNPKRVAYLKYKSLKTGGCNITTSTTTTSWACYHWCQVCQLH